MDPALLKRLDDFRYQRRFPTPGGDQVAAEVGAEQKPGPKEGEHD